MSGNIVAIFPSGSLVSYECALALRHDKCIRAVVGISSNCPGQDVTDVEGFDRVEFNAPTMGPALRRFFRTLQPPITHLVPTTDDAVRWAAEWQEDLEDRPPFHIMAPGLDVCSVAFDKRSTYERLPSISPRLYPDNAVQSWYVKPRRGHSAIGCRPLLKHEHPASVSDDMVVCEFLDGPEYTVECYDRELLGARERCITRGGMSVLTERSELDESIKFIFNTIVTTIRGLTGPWFFQVRGGKLLEIQPRIPGGGGSYRLFWGVNPIVRWIQSTRGHTIDTRPPQQICTSILKTFVDQVELDPEFQPTGIAVDWDDTLRLGTTRVRHSLLGALYAVHDLLPLILVTKHRGDLLQSLAQCHIDPNLFTQIRHLTKEQKKFHTDLQHYLLIDDSTTELADWKGPWAVDPVSAVPILKALENRLRSVTDDRASARSTILAVRTIEKPYIEGKPCAKDVLQLARVRQHVEAARLRTWKLIKGRPRPSILDIGPDKNPWQPPEGGHQIDTLDLNASANPTNPTLVGDICRYVPGPLERYDLVLCTEVLEHCISPWQAPETLWKLVRPGGLVLVTVPYNLRLHHPQPDGFRFSPVGLTNMFAEWFTVEFISVLDTPGEPLTPTHTAILFRRLEPSLSKLNWALDKGVCHMPLSAKTRMFANGGPYVRRLESEWIERMSVSEAQYEAISCCNGTIGLAAMVTAYSPQVEQWYVQSNSFWADIQNSLKDAIVLPMRTDGRCGPRVDRTLPGLIVTTCFGQMTYEHQTEYLDAARIVLFDHAAVAEPRNYFVGHGAMFSLHETKPLGRGEGGILVVPKAIAARVRGILAYAEPRRESTNGKMSEFAAFSILEWWKIWDEYVRSAFKQRVHELRKMVKQYNPRIQWMFPAEMENLSIVPASLALILERPYDLESLAACTDIPLRKYYEPLELVPNEFYERSLVAPINPGIPLSKYQTLLACAAAI